MTDELPEIEDPPILRTHVGEEAKGSFAVKDKVTISPGYASVDGELFEAIDTFVN